MIRAVIFDMDGVLIDNELLQNRVLEQLVKSYGGSVPALRKISTATLTGRSARENLKMLQKKLKLRVTVNTLIADRKRILLAVYRQHLRLRPGVARLLRQLRRAHYKLALASSTTRDIMRYVLRTIGLSVFFKLKISSEDVRNGKPAPEIFLTAARSLHVSPSACLVIEDSKLGIEAARAAGMRCIGVLHARNSKSLLRLANRIVKRISDINPESIQSL